MPVESSSGVLTVRRMILDSCSTGLPAYSYIISFPPQTHTQRLIPDEHTVAAHGERKRTHKQKYTNEETAEKHLGGKYRKALKETVRAKRERAIERE